MKVFGKGSCLECGKPFSIPPHLLRSKKFCSDRCRNDWHAKRRSETMTLLREKGK